MVEIVIAAALTLIGLVLLGLILPLVYGIVRLVGPWEAYPDCWRLLRMVARPE
jgi:hypothetical protein